MCVWKKGAKVEKIRSDNVHLNDTEIHKQKNGSTGMVLSRQSMKFINGHTIIHLLNAVYWCSHSRCVAFHIFTPVPVFVPLCQNGFAGIQYLLCVRCALFYAVRLRSDFNMILFLCLRCFFFLLFGFGTRCVRHKDDDNKNSGDVLCTNAGICPQKHSLTHTYARSQHVAFFPFSACWTTWIFAFLYMLEAQVYNLNQPQQKKRKKTRGRLDAVLCRARNKKKIGQK